MDRIKWLEVGWFLVLLLCETSCSNLNLYIPKENLKSDLNLDFGSDIYIVNEGKQAPLLSNPDAFRGLIAPLHPSIKELEFRWKSIPNDKDIKYSMSLSSSDENVMDTPKSSVPMRAYVPWYDNADTGVKISFPCTGKKTGVVDLGFHLNYTTTTTGHRESLHIVVRRQCYKNYSKKLIPATSVVKTKISKNTWSKNLIIGLVTSFLLLFVMVGGCLAYWCVQKRNRTLQMQFDYDYELKMKEREEENRRASKKEVVIDFSECDDLLQDDTDAISKPIFIPKRSHDYHRKWKRHRRHRPINSEKGNSPPRYDINESTSLYARGLEQIPEEDPQSESCGNSLSETDEDNSVLENIHSSNNKEIQSESDSNINETNFSSSGYSSAGSVNSGNVEESLTQTKTIGNKTRRPPFMYNHGPCVSSSGHKKMKDSKNTQHSLDNPAYDVSPFKKLSVSILPNSFLPNSHSDVHRCTNTRTPHEERLPLDSSKRLEELYFYLNKKWKSRFSSYLLSSHQVIVDNNPLGKGAFGHVHRGKVKGLCKDDTTKMTSVAIKIMIPSSDFDSITTFVSEALLMARFNHENIMNLLGVVLQPAHAPLIITPYMKYGDLNQLLRNARSTPRRHQTFTCKQLINFAVQIADGMSYLSSMKYIHRDLASRNCMVNENLMIKISDFGLARDVSKEHYRMNKKTRLPIKWMALESLTDYIFSEKTDVWAYGVVLWELMTLGKQPYSGLENHEMEAYLLSGKRMSQPPNCPDDIYRLISQCWLETPAKRPSFSQLHHSLVQNHSNY